MKQQAYSDERAAGVSNGVINTLATEMFARRSIDAQRTSHVLVACQWNTTCEQKTALLADGDHALWRHSYMTFDSDLTRIPCIIRTRQNDVERHTSDTLAASWLTNMPQVTQLFTTARQANITPLERFVIKRLSWYHIFIRNSDNAILRAVYTHAHTHTHTHTLNVCIYIHIYIYIYIL
jgi:hypothetical protein